MRVTNYDIAQKKKLAQASFGSGGHARFRTSDLYSVNVALSP